MPTKTFRGKITSETTDTIVLHTNKGSTGYRIKKFEIIVSNPFVAQSKGVVKIYTVPQTTEDALIDFSDNTLIAVSTYHDQPVAEDMSASKTIIFDNAVFNQDIYLTAKDLGVAQVSEFSYQLELETVTLDLNENTVATLKDIRNSA